MEAADAKSFSPDGPVSTHLFSGATWNQLSDHARASQRDFMPGAEPCDYRDLCAPTHPPEIKGQLEWKLEDWRRQGRVGRRWGRQGGGGQVCH